MIVQGALLHEAHESQGGFIYESKIGLSHLYRLAVLLGQQRTVRVLERDASGVGPAPRGEWRPQPGGEFERG